MTYSCAPDPQIAMGHFKFLVRIDVSGAIEKDLFTFSD